MTTDASPQFTDGDEVRWNYSIDRRESGWFYGTVRGSLESFGGVPCHLVDRPGGPSWVPVDLLEAVDGGK